MNGRNEHDEKVRDSVGSIVATRPAYLKDYTQSFGRRKTALTELNYVKKVCLFLDYLKDNKVIDISNGKNFEQLVPSKINNYMNTLLEKSDSTQAQTYYALKSFFKFLKADRYITENIMLDIEAPKLKGIHEIIALDKDEIHNLKLNAKYGYSHETDLESKRRDDWRERDFAIIQLGITSGFRVSSISEINIEDIDFEQHTIKIVEKGNKIRVAYLDERTIDAIRSWIAKRNEYLNKRGLDTQALFISNRCKRIATNSISVIMEHYTRDIDKHITPHKMRSTCATNLYDATEDIYLVMDQLGHSNINNTKRYTKINRQKKINASNILGSL